MFTLNTLITFSLVWVPLYVANEATAYWIVMGLSILFGSNLAILQMACYALAGPSVDLLNNFNLGVGISGLSINIFRIILLATINNNTTGAQIFFYTSGVYLMLCSFLGWRFVSEFELS